MKKRNLIGIGLLSISGAISIISSQTSAQLYMCQPDPTYKDTLLNKSKEAIKEKCKTAALAMFEALRTNKTQSIYRQNFISALQNLKVKVNTKQEMYITSSNYTYDKVGDMATNTNEYASLPKGYYEYYCLEIDDIKSAIATEINNKLQSGGVITFGGAAKTGKDSGIMSQAIYKEMEELRNNISGSEIKTHEGLNTTTTAQTLSPGIYTIVAIGAGGRAGDYKKGKTKDKWGWEKGAHWRGGEGGWASARFVTRLYLDDQKYTAQSYKSCYNSEFDGRASVFKEGNTEILHANGGGGGQTGQEWGRGESDKGGSGYKKDTLRSPTPIKYNNKDHGYCEGTCINGQGGNSNPHGNGSCGGNGAVRIFQITK